ncbi:MAG: peptidoglycan-binding protein [Thermoleophilia bacterium]|nr:peptidoglycan-binding protein [Thermoleophilia bacterium]MCZ4495424.1 peptidoglycan-binding protein [Thermoleophilia bacterium]
MPPADAPAAPETQYTVRPGDNLSVIARRYGLTWQQLYAANRAAVGANPNLIHPGLQLRIPAA